MTLPTAVPEPVLQPTDSQTCAASRLEQGEILFFPQLSFDLSPTERELLNPDLVERKRKNISFDAQRDRLSGVTSPEQQPLVRQLLERYCRFSQDLLEELFPAYRGHLWQPTASLRLHSIADWAQNSSWRKDDRRLHIDAFPSRPLHGARILRVFSNINPHGLPRRWRVGEDFETLASRYLQQLRQPNPLHTWLLAQLKITKRRRSVYDHLMLQLHDRMKADSELQNGNAARPLEFPAGSTWVCFSDQVAHAVSEGQYMLEQTVLLPIKAMHEPQRSPLRVLERLTGRQLA